MTYYAVRTGRNRGIYKTWDECKKQVHGYPNASYKKFENEKDALNFIGQEPNSEVAEIDNEFSYKDLSESHVVAYVDGSFRISDFSYSYGMVFITKEGVFEDKRAFEKDEMSSMRNVAGEIAGSMAAVELAIEKEFEKITICYDYAGIEKWATGEWKANKIGTLQYKDFMLENMKKIVIEFTKIEAHSGVFYNERADVLAKEALGIAKK